MRESRRSCAVVLALALVWGTGARSAETVLTSRADIQANSVYDPVTLSWVLNPDANGYVFLGTTSMSSPVMNITLDDANTSLSINASMTTDNALGAPSGIFTLGEGSLLANGAATSFSSGLRVGQFDTLAGTSGSVVANGNNSHGIEVRTTYGGGNSTFTHAGSGSVIATGGEMTASMMAGVGIVTDFFRTVGNHGLVQVTGSSTGQVGMMVGDFFHDGSGMVEAIGGADQVLGGFTGAGMDGIYVTGGLAVEGELKLVQQGRAAAIAVQGVDSTTFLPMATSVTFSATSTIIPEIDLARTQQSDDRSHLTVTHGNVEIASGATVRPIITNLASLTPGDAREYEFISTTYGVINGEFTLDASPSLILDYQLVAEKDGGDTKYFLRFGARGTPGQIIADNGYCSANTQRLINAMGTGLNGQTGPEAALLNALYDPFATMGTVLDMAKYATQLSLTLTPQQFSRLTDFSMRQMDSVHYNLLDNTMRFRSAFRQSDQFQMRNWTLWADPVFHASWDHSPKTCGFSKTDEKFGGFNLGFSKAGEEFSFGASVHYLRGSVDGSGYDTDSDTFGFMAAGRYDFLSDNASSVLPWIEATAGYSYVDYSQRRRDFIGSWHKSSPDANLFRLGVSTGVDVAVTPSLRITPKFGLDYTCIDQGSYSEGNANDLGLRVRSKTYQSFRPSVGIEFEGKVSDAVSVTGRLNYRYEAADNRARLRYNFISVPTVAAKFEGEDVHRSSGNAGLGIRYQVNERTSVGANYDLWLEDHYVGHQFGLSFAMGF